MAISILIVDDHKMFRDGLKTLLLQKLDLSEVHEAENGMKAITIAEKYHPDIAIVDISMPELNGLEATRQIIQNSPNTTVIILSMHSDRRFVVEALKAGAKGYLLKDTDIDELVQAIKNVLVNRPFVDSKISDLIIRDYIDLAHQDESSAFKLLSAREREVLQKIAEGKSTREIADMLFVSVKTIETYRKNIMDKLDLHSIAELTKYAIREGLTSL